MKQTTDQTTATLEKEVEDRFDERFCFDDPIDGKKLFTNKDQTQEVKQSIAKAIQQAKVEAVAAERGRIKDNLTNVNYLACYGIKGTDEWKDGFKLGVKEAVEVMADELTTTDTDKRRLWK